MEILNTIISVIHTLSASLSIIFGVMVLVGVKGGLRHKKLGLWYFYAMLINNLSALLIYNASGKWFFPHWLAVITLGLLIPGYLMSKYKPGKYWKGIHIICMTLSYYMLIGGAVNEAFIHIKTLTPLMRSNSPVFGMTHFAAQIFFIVLLIYFMVKYRNKKLLNPQQ